MMSLPQPIRSHQTQLPNCSLKQIKNTLAIASGKGGVGKSTVAVNLAVALSKLGARVGLLDADIYGPSSPLLMGINQKAAIEKDKYVPIVAHGIQMMSIGCITDPDQALIWRGPMLAKALIQMLDATAWDNLDYLLIDLPPGTGDIQLSLVQKIPLTAAIVVTTPQAMSTIDVNKAIQMFQKTHIHILGLVENMSMHTCSACGHQDTLFGQGGAAALCERYTLPLLAQFPLDASILTSSDTGMPSALNTHHPVGQLWRTFALTVAEAISTRPVHYGGMFPEIKVE